MKKISFYKLLNRLSLCFVFLAISAVFAATSYVVLKSNNSAIDLNKILVDAQGNVSKAFFSPDNDIQNILINIINQEQEGILLAIYCFTQKETANALINAYKRGVKVEVVSDREFAVNRSSKIPYLANQKIPVWVFQNDSNLMYTPLMHNKFIIFKKNFENKSLIWTGSYNFTQGANLRNQENVVILDNREIIEKFTEQFAILKSRSLQISGIKAELKSENYSEKNKSLLNECGQYLKDFFHIIGIK